MRNHNSMNSFLMIGIRGSWHMQHEMRLCLAQNRLRRAGLGYSQSLAVHKHNLDLLAAGRLISPPWARTTSCCSSLMTAEQSPEQFLGLPPAESILFIQEKYIM